MRYVIEFRDRDYAGSIWQRSGNRERNERGERGTRYVNEIEYPDLATAQEQARRQQEHAVSSEYRARDTQPHLPQLLTREGAYSMEPAAAPSRTVRIYRRNRQWVVDCGGREEPGIPALHPYMTPSARQACRNRGDYSISDALIHGASPQMLASALSAWFTEHPNSGDNVQMEEGASELGSNSAYLAMGDYIYKMVPVRQAGSSKAVRLMREKVRVEIERVREGLRAQAAQEAQQVIAQANLQATRIRSEAEAERQTQASGIRFPEWLVGQTLKAGVGVEICQSWVLSKTQLLITELAHGDKRWPMNPERRAIKVNFWLPLSGSPDYVRLQEGSLDLPHVTSYSCCLKIGERIEPITSMERVLRFSNQVIRAFSVINLASLLTADFRKWNPEVTALLPEPIKVWLTRYNDLRTQRDDPDAIRALPPTDILERREETWSVR